MVALDVLLTVAGLIVTILVVAGMILSRHVARSMPPPSATDPQDSAEPSRRPRDRPAHTAARRRRVGPAG